MAEACGSDRAGTKRFGAPRWLLIRRRLASILAARSLADLAAAPGRCHALTGRRRGQLAIALDGPYRLVFEPAHNPVPLLADGGLDWAGVTRVRILEVVDYHDE